MGQTAGGLNTVERERLGKEIHGKCELLKDPAYTEKLKSQAHIQGKNHAQKKTWENAKLYP